MSNVDTLYAVWREQRPDEALFIGDEDGMPTARLTGSEGVMFEARGSNVEDAACRLLELLEAAP
jgi:hypothetical protein